MYPTKAEALELLERIETQMAVQAREAKALSRVRPWSRGDRMVADKCRAAVAVCRRLRQLVERCWDEH